VLAGIVSTMALVAPVSAVSAAHSEIVGSVPLQTLSRFAFRDQQRAAGDPLEGNPIWIADIEGMIRRDFQAVGKTEAATPDVYVAFYVKVGTPYNMNIDYTMPRADGDTARTERVRDPSTIPYKTTTVIIDLVDARTNQLVWRGYDSDTFSARDPDKTLDAAVHNVMTRLEKDFRR